MNPLDSFPSEKLTPAAELAFYARIKKGEEAAITGLAVAAMHEAVTYTRHCCGAKIPDDELISICYDVLYRGAKRFNPKYKVRFVAFCKPGLRGYVRRSWRSKDIVKGVNHTQIESNSLPTSEVLEGAHRKESKRSQGMGALWDDADEVAPEYEIIEADFHSIFLREKWALVEEIIKRRCKPREQAVLELAYKNGLNFAEIAKMLGVTRSAIQSTHAGALKKIRGELLSKKRLFTE